MSEQKTQAKILQHLKANNFLAMKTIVMNRAGIPDIIACSPEGRFWAIEVKTPNGRASKLQEWWIDQLQRRQAIAFFAYGYDDYLQKFDNSTIVQ